MNNASKFVEKTVFYQCKMTPSNFIIFLMFFVCQVSSVHSLSRVQFSDSMDSSMAGFPVHHQLAELTQTHVHWVHDAFQPPHPLLNPSPPAFNLCQYQSFYKWVSSLYQVAKYWSFSFSISPSNEFPLGLSGWISLQFKRLSKVFCNTIVKNHQFSALSFLYSPTLTSIHDYWKNNTFD